MEYGFLLKNGFFTEKRGKKWFLKVKRDLQRGFSNIMILFYEE